MRIFLVEPYLTGSHEAWARGYAAASRHEVHLIAHEGRFWKWRMQGAALTLADQISSAIDEHGPPDVVLASSLTNLPALLALTRPESSGAATALYMHENQLTYPLSPRDVADASYAMVNWLSMAASDLVLFNSEFHRTAWFEKLPAFLRQFPDYRHEPHHVEAVRSRSEVMPVGVDLARLDGRHRRSEPPLILWNQRCEYDKGPDDFVAAMLALAGGGAAFRLALAGERFVSEPSDFDRLRAECGDRIVHDGFAAEKVYGELLRSADIVVSTARQEFFGIAITEAVYAGAFPLLPDRLVYPERVPRDRHARCLHRDHDDLVAKLHWAVTHRDERSRVATELARHMAQFDWSVIGPRYDARLEELAGHTRR